VKLKTVGRSTEYSLTSEGKRHLSEIHLLEKASESVPQDTSTPILRVTRDHDWGMAMLSLFIPYGWRSYSTDSLPLAEKLYREWNKFNESEQEKFSSFMELMLNLWLYDSGERREAILRAAKVRTLKT
jgi:hypothetical protein